MKKIDQTEFDRFADEYDSLHQSNIRASGEDPEYFAAYKARDLAHAIGKRGNRGDEMRILDFGTGVGGSLPHLRQEFPCAQLVGVDVSHRSLTRAHTRLEATVPLVTFDGKHLPFATGSFDAALAACVFHHIPDDLHVALLSEIRRVLQPGGVLMVYEHNPLNPLTVRAVNTCPFDENAVLIRAKTLRERMRAAGFDGVTATYRVFFPSFLKMLRPLEGWLGRVPFGAQYYATGSRPRPSI